MFIFAAKQARAVAPFARRSLFGAARCAVRRKLRDQVIDHPERRCLVGDHALQHSLVGIIGDHPCVKLVFTFARLGRENVPGECMLPDNLPRPGFFEPFRRTFVGLQFGHEIFRET
jgi:hypothetical protein